MTFASPNEIKRGEGRGRGRGQVTVTIQLPVAPLHDLTYNHEPTWNIVRRGWAGQNENSWVEEMPEGPVLCVRFPQGSINPSHSGVPVGGVGFYSAPLDIFPALDVELKYQLMFDPTFQPQLGGKLPGLFMSPVDNRQPHHAGSGGHHDQCVSSVRLMWRKDWQAEAYVYSTAAHKCPAYHNIPCSHHNPQYGDSLWRGIFFFQPQAWNTVSVRARMNTVGAADGLLLVTVNGITQSFDQMIWRCDPRTVISSIFFSTFYGGSSEKYACPNDTAVRFKDFVVTRAG